MKAFIMTVCGAALILAVGLFALVGERPATAAGNSAVKVPVTSAPAGTVGSATLSIQSSIDGTPWRAASAIYPLKGQKVSLRVNKEAGGVPRWYRIQPDVSKIYKNANHPWEPDPYKWVGLAVIDYSREELTECRGQWEIHPFPVPKREEPEQGLGDRVLALLRKKPEARHQREDVGSFWFQVEVENDGKVKRSPGIEDSDKRGISPKVFRVSIRDGEGYLGYVTTFFNVPGLFGSVPYQCSNYIGADCCDVLTAAYGAWTGWKFTKDYSVAMLVDKLPQLAECNITGGSPDRPLLWEKRCGPAT